MNIDWVRTHCMGLPHTTEEILWGDDLVFKIGGKMYAVVVLAPAPKHNVVMSFKCTPEVFAELVERPGIIPAPYSARSHWVALEREDALPRVEIKRRIRDSYGLVVAKLPKKKQRSCVRNSGRASTPARDFLVPSVWTAKSPPQVWRPAPQD